jgi:hypothetical protein
MSEFLSGLYVGLFVGPVLTSLFQCMKPFVVQAFCKRRYEHIPNVADTFNASYEGSMFDTSEPTDEEILREAAEALMALKEATLEASRVVDDLTDTKKDN